MCLLVDMEISSWHRECRSSRTHHCGYPDVTEATKIECATPIARPAQPLSEAEKILTSKAVLEAERNQVPVLFADLKGSMQLLAGREREEARNPRSRPGRHGTATRVR
jgi:hypothetical protein